MADRLSALADAYRPGSFGAIPPAGPGLTIAERRPFAMVQVAAHRGAGEAVRAALGAALGVTPSATPNRAAATHGMTVLWLGPERWLVAATGRPDGNLHDHLRRSIGSDQAAITDLGHARSVLRIAGRHARAVLEKGCSLDFHPRRFPPGCCAQSLLGHVAALFHAVDDEPSFDIYFARSFALSVWEWLAESAAEFGYRVAPIGSGEDR
ncbi:MAG: hypothetical protein JO010_06320 [Alphaproteobacteria bacterium]|nr:hypothetical protein [Alphaproteobacteria bacterium]